MGKKDKILRWIEFINLLSKPLFLNIRYDRGYFFFFRKLTLSSWHIDFFFLCFFDWRGHMINDNNYKGWWIFTFFVTSCMGPKKQGFWPRINWSQMKLPDFESPFGDSLSKSSNFGLSKWIFNVKNHPNISKKNVHWRISIKAHLFCKQHFLLTSIFKSLYY